MTVNESTFLSSYIRVKTADRDRGNPEDEASFLSKLFFLWIQPLMVKGYEKPLKLTDVFPVRKDLSSKTLTDTLAHHWEREKATREHPSLLRALLRAHRWLITKVVVCSQIEAVCTVLPSFFIVKITSYLNKDSDMSLRDALIYACLFSLINHFQAVYQNMYEYSLVNNLGPSLRISASSLVYDKACRTTCSDLSYSSVGHIITLITNDCERFAEGVLPLQIIFTFPLILVGSFFFSLHFLGLVVTVTAFAAFLISTLVQSIIGKRVKNNRRKAVVHTDDRIKKIGEIITSMKVIKMYNWESYFEDVVIRIRALETCSGIFLSTPPCDCSTRFSRYMYCS